MRVIISGGGTGGHIFPAVAIGQEIKRQYPDAAILFVGANGKMEMEKVPQEGFEIIGLDIAGLNRSQWWKNIMLPIKIIKSRIKSRSIIKDFRPDIAIGVGGYASFSVLSAAQSMGIPTLIQEQNSYAGKTNKILGKKAESICVAYDGMERFFPKEKIAFTGNPVRSLIVDNAKTKSQGLQAFGLDPQCQTILIVGGSLGAVSINNAIIKHIETLGNDKSLQLIWQTGTVSYSQAKDVASPYPNIVVRDFIRNMDDAYAAADIIISRAGAMAISELCIIGKPVIFVPYPYAAEDHQTSNAKALVDKGAAISIPNQDVGVQLIPTLQELLRDESRSDAMSVAIRKCGITDATHRIINEVKKILGK